MSSHWPQTWKGDKVFHLALDGVVFIFFIWGDCRGLSCCTEGSLIKSWHPRLSSLILRTKGLATGRNKSKRRSQWSSKQWWLLLFNHIFLERKKNSCLEWWWAHCELSSTAEGAHCQHPPADWLWQQAPLGLAAPGSSPLGNLYCCWGSGDHCSIHQLIGTDSPLSSTSEFPMGNSLEQPIP